MGGKGAGKTSFAKGGGKGSSKSWSKQQQQQQQQQQQAQQPQQDAAGAADSYGSGAASGKPPAPTHEFSLDSRPYSAALQDLFKGTTVRPNDFDPKAVQLLDALHAADKAHAAVAHLSKSLDGVGRDKVTKPKAYIFALLRAFDKDVYTSMRESRGWPKPRRSDIEKSNVVVTAELNATAPEFVPGQPWFGAGQGMGLATTPAFVPAAVPTLATVPAEVPSPAPAPSAAVGLEGTEGHPAKGEQPAAGAATSKPVGDNGTMAASKP